MAACLMLVVFLGTYHSMHQSSSDRSLAMTNSLNLTPETAVAGSVESIGTCFTGPGQGPVAPECACADLDADGDVDLRDMSAIQLQMGRGP